MSDFDQQRISQREVIGLLPAGGKATRLSPLPFSKELYPIGFHPVGQNGSLRPKVVCHYLLEKMRLAGISKSFIIIRKGKWDIPSYLGDGKTLDMRLAYLMLDLPFGVPYTLDQAYPFIQNATVAFGFPDIIFDSEDAFVQLLNRQVKSNADVVLGLFPTKHPQKWDTVDFDENGRVRRIVIKSSLVRLRHAWVIAVWKPIFTNFMHRYISNLKELMDQNGDQNYNTAHGELYMGDIIQAAIQNDMKINSVLFSDSFCLDIGTPEDLIEAANIIRKKFESSG